MQQTSIDGVTTFWEQGPEPLTAILMFRVGARHESFRTAQITHLVEHLVMGTLPKSHLDHNAQVDLDTTTFYATGGPAEVTEFLSMVCAALRELPVDRIAREAGVLEAEEGSSEHPAVCWSLGLRYGFTGAGLVSTSGPGPRHHTADQVQQFAATHFVRDNAVLVLTGAPPAGLRLDLPAGPRPDVVPGRRSTLPLPAALHDDLPYPTLSVELPGLGEHRSILGAILCERLTDDLRHERGIAYECDFAMHRLDDSTLLTVFTDGHEDKRDLIAGALWDTLRALATDGPTQAEVDHEIARDAAGHADPRATVDWLAAQAYRHLNDLPVKTREQHRRSIERVTPEMVRGWAAKALPSALMGLPEGLDARLDGLPDRTEDQRPEGPAVAGETFGRKTLSLAPRDLRVTAGDAGIAQTVDHYRLSSPWHGVVGVAAAPGLRQLVLDSGASMLLVQRHVKNGERLFEMVDSRLADRMFDVSEEEILSGG